MEAKEAFQRLKRIFLTKLTLACFNYNKEIRVETNSSGWYIKGILLQANADGLFVPCLFYLRKLNRAECNYKIYNKEMLAIVHSLEEFNSELRGLSNFKVYLDHKNLEYFIIMRKLTE